MYRYKTSIKSTVSRLVPGLFLLLLAILVHSRPADASVQVTTLAYGDSAAQTLDLYQPVSPSIPSVPTVLLAHGGLWQSGKRSLLAELCTNIVARSGDTIACASMDYRLSQDLGGTCEGTGTDAYIEQVSDMALAFRFLQDQAGRHGLDPYRMHVGGHSAGAHMAQTLNLRWKEFEKPCDRFGGCPPAIGAIGLEGIYDIPAWDEYESLVWGGRFSCATRKAFGAPGPAPAACLDAWSGERCWDAGSPIFLARNTRILGSDPVGDVLLVHSPGDDAVDISEAINFGAMLGKSFPDLDVSTITDGTCASGQHNGVLEQVILADCIIGFVATRYSTAQTIPSTSIHGIILLITALTLVASGALYRQKRS